MSKRIPALLAMTLLAAILTGCGGQAAGGATSGEPESVVSPAEPEDAEPTETADGASGVSEPLAEWDSYLFPDTTNHPAEFEIAEACYRGYLAGFEDGSFRPDEAVTRGAFAAALWTMAGRPEPEENVSFADADAMDANTLTAARWAQAYGLGSGEDAFSPDEPVKRQEAASILYRYSGQSPGMGLLLSGIYDDVFTDSGQIDPQMKPALYWAVYNEFISADDGHALRPGESATRSLAAVMMVRYADDFLGEQEGGVVP